jgi:hypothetical protein
MFAIIFTSCVGILLAIAIACKMNAMESRNVIFGGREFEVYLESQYGASMCVVTIWEVVRPKWKIFRTKYRDTRSFWISDYETIKQGIYAMIDSYIKDEEEAERISNKWKELDNGN